ncbi:glutathione transferase GstA [Pseudomonas sp. Pseusp122]|uniref:glutathione transferase GstA n=1 Tax=unclassified Pseudomonas TaxID=196821 RepID=UPI0039A71CBA
MKLYYAPHACSLAAHIVLHEIGQPFELVRVNNKTKRTDQGDDFLTINPKGYVAALQLDDGQVLTEGPVILQYLADLAPEAGLAPSSGTFERVRLNEWLSFINSEVHAGMNPLFNPMLVGEIRTLFENRLSKRLDYLNERLQEHDYLLGARFSLADAYLFTVLGWLTVFTMELERWPALAQLVERVSSRPAVKAALKAEAQAA